MSLTLLSPSLSCPRPRRPLVLKDSSQISCGRGLSLESNLTQARQWAKTGSSGGVSFLPLGRFPAASPQFRY